MNNKKSVGLLIAILVVVVVAMVILGIDYFSKKNIETEINNEIIESNQNVITSKVNIENKTTSTATTTNEIPKEITLDISTEFAKQYQTVLIKELAKPANFNSHYRMVVIGCGSSCGNYKLLDKNSGKIYNTPISNDLSLYSSVDFSVDSPNLLLNYSDGKKENYHFESGVFVKQ